MQIKFLSVRLSSGLQPNGFHSAGGIVFVLLEMLFPESTDCPGKHAPLSCTVPTRLDAGPHHEGEGVKGRRQNSGYAIFPGTLRRRRATACRGRNKSNSRNPVLNFVGWLQS